MPPDDKRIRRHGERCCTKDNDPTLVSLWLDYVMPETRWAHIRPFLYHFLDVCRRDVRLVIDMDAGMGVEY